VFIIWFYIGYPPPDHELRTWLIPSGIKNDDRATLDMVWAKLHGFVYALFDVTYERLQSIEGGPKNRETPQNRDEVIHRQKYLASTFRNLMTEGQSFKGPNTYRKDFYKRVMEKAGQSNVSIREFPHFREDDSFPPKLAKDGDGKGKVPPYVSGIGDRIDNAGRKLVRFIDPIIKIDSEGQPRRPLVVISFDEAHVLTDTPSIPDREPKWNMFSELRRILRQASDHAIFSLFLSTAARGRFSLFSPKMFSDPSKRIARSNLRALDPITEISFDDLAYPTPEYTIQLENVVGIDWMCHLGRPLYVFVDYHSSEQLTFHLEQIRVHLRRGE
jgi:hypothetical protein